MRRWHRCRCRGRQPHSHTHSYTHAGRASVALTPTSRHTVAVVQPARTSRRGPYTLSEQLECGAQSGVTPHCHSGTGLRLANGAGGGGRREWGWEVGERGGAGGGSEWWRWRGGGGGGGEGGGAAVGVRSGGEGLGRGDSRVAAVEVGWRGGWVFGKP